MWDLPGPQLEPVSPALAGGFLTTAPPGKSLSFIFLTCFSPCSFLTFLLVSLPAFPSASISLCLFYVPPFCESLFVSVLPPPFSHPSPPLPLSLSPFLFFFQPFLPGLSVSPFPPVPPRCLVSLPHSLPAGLSSHLFLARPRLSPRHPVCLSLCFPGRQL